MELGDGSPIFAVGVVSWTTGVVSAVWVFSQTMGVVSAGEVFSRMTGGTSCVDSLLVLCAAGGDMVV